MTSGGITHNITNKKPLRIGLVYDRTADYQHAEGPADRFAEFEPNSTIEAMEQAVRLAGHHPLRIGSPQELLQGPDFPTSSGSQYKAGSAKVSSANNIDLVWNIGEGYGSRNREAWAPVLCELKGIPCLGSDAYTLTVTLDKVLTKMIARSLGIPTSDWQIIAWNNPCSQDSSGRRTNSHLPDPELPFPQFLKPRYEGTSKGISEKSVVRTPEEFHRQCRYLLETYHQDVMAEPFIEGPEITCALSGHPLQPHPVMERGLDASGIGSHALDPHNPDADEKDSRTGSAGSDDSSGEKSSGQNSPGIDAPSHISGIITPELEEQIATRSIALCNWLCVRDFVRLDYKMVQNGTPLLLEVNPLPTFGTDSTFAILAEIQSRSYPEFLSGILTDAIRRLKQEL